MMQSRDVSMDDAAAAANNQQQPPISPAAVVDDDDNAAVETDASDDEDVGQGQGQSPLDAALDDLESRVVAALNEFKSHSGRASNPVGGRRGGRGGSSVHDELSEVLRPVLEVSCHVGPSTARSLPVNYPHLYGGNVDHCVDEVYAAIVSGVVLPVLLESAQSDAVPAKRAASLAAFHALHVEWHAAGSYLDGTTAAPSLAGPYGPGLAHHSAAAAAGAAAPPISAEVAGRRQQARSARRSELLRRWVQASVPNLAPGTFTSASLDAAVAGRAVLSASAALRPCLRYMADRIEKADDAGALRLFLPVMRMISGVLGRLFLERARGGDGAMMAGGGSGNENSADSLRASCVKFLEVVVLCFSNRALPGAGGQGAAQLRLQKKDKRDANDFSLEDLPPGHPIITREGLEEIGEYCFSTLRGLVLLGGQAAIDPNLLLAAAASSGGGGSGSDFAAGSSPLAQILDVLKPAALAFLKIESAAERAGAQELSSSQGGGDSTNKISFVLDRSSVELDFALSQKSYSLSINAVQMLATRRPVFFKESSTCLARRAIDPPGGADGDAHEGALTKAAVTGLRTHLRSSCLTLLRNVLSVTSGSWEVLSEALNDAGMKAQADRALQSSRQQLDLMKGGRAARNRAAIFYEWDTSADTSRAAKRQRDTDDAEAQARAAKVARGLGGGIQLPPSMVDACELVMLNLENLPPKRPPVASSSADARRKRPVDLDFVVDAVVTNGASLAVDENHWYDRDGGDAWTMEEGEVGEDGRRELIFAMNDRVLEAATKSAEGGKLGEPEKAFAEQSKLAASQAFSRVLVASSNARSEEVADMSKQLAARLAWTLKDVKPSSDIERANELAAESLAISMEKNPESAESLESSLDFVSRDYPLVSSCLAYDLVPKGTAAQRNEDAGTATLTSPVSSLAMRILNEAYVCSLNEDKENYERALDVFVSSIVYACDVSNKMPSDNEKKRIANSAASALPQQLGAAPFINGTALGLVSSLCDIDELCKKADAKSSKQSIAEHSALQAAKQAAEKRATAALLILRDVAFQRDAMRGAAIDCAVAIASGRVPGSPSIEEKARRLVVNSIFSKNSDCEDKVIQSAAKEMEMAAKFAITNHDKIAKANEASAKKKDRPRNSAKAALLPQSDEEKVALDRVKKPVVLSMALIVRRPELIKSIMESGCREGADLLAKAIKANMPKLTRASATKHGAANIALRVSGMASEKETPLLLSFLDNLTPPSDKTLPSQELIDACHEIQKNKLTGDGKPDSRFIIPVVSGMKREQLVEKLPEFVRSSDDVFKASLRRMSERLGRYMLIFRDEPDPKETTLRGMSSCEQLVCLHHLDFHAVGIPQKRYLDVIRLCLNDDEVFNDRVVQAALDHMSGKFLEGESLPLAYMRTIILTCSKHESLHSWICHVLLPRLVEGKVYTDKRQWEGWMRCAQMLENSRDHGVSSLEAIQKLPKEQLELYRTRYPLEK